MGIAMSGLTADARALSKWFNFSLCKLQIYENWVYGTWVHLWKKDAFRDACSPGCRKSCSVHPMSCRRTLLYTDLWTTSLWSWFAHWWSGCEIEWSGWWIVEGTSFVPHLSLRRVSWIQCLCDRFSLSECEDKSRSEVPGRRNEYCYSEWWS